MRRVPASTMLLLLACTGCVARTSSVPHYVAKAGVAVRPPVPADSVEIYTMDTLPDGVMLASTRDRSPASQLEIEEDFPTPDAPHVILGHVTLDHARGQQPLPQDVAHRKLAEEAGKHGANAIIVFKRMAPKTAVALVLSRAEPTAAFADASELLTAPPDGVPATAVVENTVARTLDVFEPVMIESKRGTCYAVRLALGTAARLGTHARRSLRLALESNDNEIAITQHPLGSDLPRDARTFSRKLGCPQVDGRIAIDLEAAFGSASSRARLHELGTGEVYFRIHAYPIDERALQAQAEATQKSIKDAEASRDAHTRKTCSACRRKKDECLEKNLKGCVDDFDRCVFASGLRRDACH